MKNGVLQTGGVTTGLCGEGFQKVDRRAVLLLSDSQVLVSCQMAMMGMTQADSTVVE